MINENADEIIKNNDRATYLKGSKTPKNTKDNNQSMPDGPIQQDKK